MIAHHLRRLALAQGCLQACAQESPPPRDVPPAAERDLPRPAAEEPKPN